MRSPGSPPHGNTNHGPRDQSNERSRTGIRSSAGLRKRFRYRPPGTCLTRGIEERDRTRPPVDADPLARSDALGRHAGPENGGDVVLPGDDRAVCQDPAYVGHQTARLGEERRPRGGRGGAHQDRARLHPQEVVWRADDAGRSTHLTGADSEATQGSAFWYVASLSFKGRHVERTHAHLIVWRYHRRRVQPLAGLAQFAPPVRQVRKLGTGLARVARRDGRFDLGGLEEEDVFGREQRATLDQPPSQLECQPPQGGPTSSHVEECLLSVRAEALRPAKQRPECFPTQRIEGSRRLLHKRIAFGDDGLLARTWVVAGPLHHRLEAQQDR